MPVSEPDDTVSPPDDPIKDVDDFVRREQTLSSDQLRDLIIDVIKDQHQQVKTLLTEVATAKGEALEARFCDLRRLLAVHETAEEEIIYPTIRTAGEQAREVADARTGEEAEGIKVLSELESLELGSAEFEATFEKFRKAVLAHAEHEEQEVLPLIMDNRDADERRKMGTLFEMAEKAAPTHPHPHAGTSAASHIVAGPALAIMDRVRDALRKS